MSTQPEEHGAGRTLLACIAAWLIPGAGHFLLGRRGRGVVFFLLVGTTFSLGLAFDGKPAVVDRRQPLLSWLQVFANVGAGPAEMVARRCVLGELTYVLPADDAGPTPRSPVGLKLREITRSARTGYGTAYLWTAGLMNILLILDAFDIGIGRKS